jgi:hypothetical protein
MSGVSVQRGKTFIGLMVRAAAGRVSNHGAAPSFETGAVHPPQDEGGAGGLV